MRKSLFIILAIFIFSLTLLAYALEEENMATGATKTPVPARDSQMSRPEQLEYFSDQLQRLYEQINEIEKAGCAHIYRRVSGIIDATQLMLERRPRHFRTNAAFDICSVMTEAALLQMQTELNLHKAKQLGIKKDSLLYELHNIHETINGLERSHASLLREKLENTQQILDEEREAARKLMEEAQNRFSELESELISVSKDARGTIISMSDILFDVGKSNLTTNLKTSLARIAGILIIYKDANVIVEGHTDNVGSEQFNQKLSEDRALNVMNFLIEQGVSDGRLQYIGYAFHRPVADNSTPAGRAQNRRVDLIIQDSRL